MRQFIYFNFNPRLREGGDACHSGNQGHRIQISIHASAKEATYSGFVYYESQFISIHASAKEATGFHVLNFSSHHFNPRLREGGDQLLTPIHLYISYFNPRLREGGDFFWCGWLFTCSISIHASAKEATQFSIFLVP